MPRIISSGALFLGEARERHDRRRIDRIGRVGYMLVVLPAVPRSPLHHGTVHSVPYLCRWSQGTAGVWDHHLKPPDGNISRADVLKLIISNLQWSALYSLYTFKGRGIVNGTRGRGSLLHPTSPSSSSTTKSSIFNCHSCHSSLSPTLPLSHSPTPPEIPLRTTTTPTLSPFRNLPSFAHHLTSVQVGPGSQGRSPRLPVFFFASGSLHELEPRGPFSIRKNLFPTVKCTRETPFKPRLR